MLFEIIINSCFGLTCKNQFDMKIELLWALAACSLIFALSTNAFATEHANSYKCFDCDFPNRTGPCCTSKELCPGKTPCCATCPSGNCGCQTNCTPQCDGRVCGSGGCSKSDCGTCGEGLVCNPEGKCVTAHCYDCATGPSASCCQGKQLCPDQSECCIDCPSGNCDCNTWCQPNCTNRQCGNGGCSPDDCGMCGPHSSCDGNSCICASYCQCSCKSGTSTSKCPTESLGCSSQGCSCLGPQNPVTVAPLTYLEVKRNWGDFCCDVNYPGCGGYIPMDSNTLPGLAATFNGQRMCTNTTSVMVIYSGLPASVEHLYMYFPKGMANSCPTESFVMSISNCTKTNYAPCVNRSDPICFTREDPKGCGVIETLTPMGNATGMWFKSPKVPTFSVTFSLSDPWWEDHGCGNSASMYVNLEALTLSYHGS